MKPNLNTEKLERFTKEQILIMYRVPAELFDQMEPNSSLQLAEFQKAWIGESLITGVMRGDVGD